MRTLIQRVSNSTLRIDNEIHSSIKRGLLVLVGVEDADTQEDIDWLVGKICQLRIFDDQQGIMNLSVEDIDAEVMVVSQFTLHAAVKKGNRPSYIRASKPDIAIPLYEGFKRAFASRLGDNKLASGVFGADMKIELVNDGPVTIFIDSKNRE